MPRPAIIFFVATGHFISGRRKVWSVWRIGDDTIIIDEGISNWSCLFLW